MKTSTTVIFAILAVVAFASSVLCSDALDEIAAKLKNVRATSSSSFDYFVFAMTWPGNACRELSPCVIPSNTNDFTIHGLWPSRNSGPLGPFFCGGTFVYSQVQDLANDLNTYWTDFKNEQPSFWKHEYEKHGTCAASLSRFDSEYKFFSTVIQLRKSMSVLPSLQSAGISPSDSRSYHIDQIKSALGAAGYGTPAIACLHGGQYLTELRFCTDKSLNFIQCPIKDQCSDNVFLNPIQN